MSEGRDVQVFGQVEPAQAAPPQHQAPLLLGKVAGANQLSRAGFAEGERVVAAQHDLVGPYLRPSKLQHLGVSHPAVDPELAEELARVDSALDLAQVGPHFEAVLDAAEGGEERAAAVGEGDSERGVALEDAAEDEGANALGGLGGHADEPGQPVPTRVCNERNGAEGGVRGGR